MGFDTEIRDADDRVVGQVASVDDGPLPMPPSLPLPGNPRPREDMPAGVERGKFKGDDCPWLTIALGELGEHELPGRDKNNPRIIEYHQATSLRATDDETPWCSSFENWCMKQAGETGTDNAAARSWEKWGVPTEPRRGAIVVLRRGHNEWEGHVGTLLAWDSETVTLVSGNVSDQVCVRKFPRRDVIAMRWPKRMSNSTTVAAAGGEGMIIAVEKIVNDPQTQKMMDLSVQVSATLAIVFALGHLTCLGWIVYQRYLRLTSSGT